MELERQKVRKVCGRELRWKGTLSYGSLDTEAKGNNRKLGDDLPASNEIDF